MRGQQQRRRGRGRAVIPLIMASLALATFPSIPAEAESRTFYLDGNGAPLASLSPSSPGSSSLANHDSGRNDDPGLTIQKGGDGADETDPTKHQLWVGPSGGVDLDGPVSFTFWSAMKDFDPDKKGSVWVYLLDCTVAGTGCTTIDAVTDITNPWNPAGSWISNTLSFGNVTHTVAEDRALALKIVVRSNSNDDMWFAYDSTTHASSLTVELATATPPPATTTTTTVPTATTTTTVPTPATTTTTTRAPATTTTTSTTQAPRSTTTTTLPTPTTTTAGPPTTATSPSDATTTTIPDDPVHPEPPELDVAMAALPDEDGTNRGTAPEPHSLSGALFEGLDVAIPPVVASVILSPLMILEALLGAFIETGRELVIPTVLLLAASIWMLYDTRRERRRSQAEPT